jgi:hypothetical protein
MPNIEITDSEDQRLMEVVPEVLRGANCAAKRVRWAIHECLRGLAEGHPSVNADSVPIPGPNLPAKC